MLVLIATSFYFGRSTRVAEMPRPLAASRVSPAGQQFSVASSVAPTSGTATTFAPPSYNVASQPVTQPPSTAAADQTARFEQERQRREQLQREQAANADRIRAETAQRDRERTEAAGRDEHVELDQRMMIDVGGSWTSVKIHDNNVSSFDAWINGTHYPNIQKQKGITGSRTDETPIYGTGAATLYYVWEISGKLNHCLLRVRKA